MNAKYAVVNLNFNIQCGEGVTRLESKMRQRKNVAKIDHFYYCRCKHQHFVKHCKAKV